MKHQKPDVDDAAALRVSMMADGELAADEVEALCQQWAVAEPARERWHAYHLIGDVLRSDELCGRGRDERFLLALRERLAAEPVQLAPQALPADAVGRRARSRPLQWARSTWASAGMAAGVALVAGAVWVNRPGNGAAPTLAVASSTGRATVLKAAVPVHALPAATARPAPALSQAQLERYIAAHRQFQSAAALSPASGYLRDAVYESAVR